MSFSRLYNADYSISNIIPNVAFMWESQMFMKWGNAIIKRYISINNRYVRSTVNALSVACYYYNPYLVRMCTSTVVLAELIASGIQKLRSKSYDIYDILSESSHILFGLSCSALCITVDCALAPRLSPNDMEDNKIQIDVSTSPTFDRIFYSCIAASIFEEHTYGLFSNPAISTVTDNSVIRIIITALMFSFGHCIPHHTNQLKFYMMSKTFINGLIRGTLYKYTHNIWASIVCHSLNNTINTLSAYSGYITLIN